MLAKGYEVPSRTKDTTGEPMRSAPNGEIRDLYEELAAVRNALPEVPPLGGEIPVALPLRPKSIQEAGELALKVFKNHKK